MSIRHIAAFALELGRGLKSVTNQFFADIRPPRAAFAIKLFRPRALKMGSTAVPPMIRRSVLQAAAAAPAPPLVTPVASLAGLWSSCGGHGPMSVAGLVMKRGRGRPPTAGGKADQRRIARAQEAMAAAMAAATAGGLSVRPCLFVFGECVFGLVCVCRITLVSSCLLLSFFLSLFVFRGKQNRSWNLFPFIFQSPLFFISILKYLSIIKKRNNS